MVLNIPLMKYRKSAVTPGFLFLGFPFPEIFEKLSLDKM